MFPSTFWPSFQMFPPFRMTWPLTGHVLAPVNGFHVSVHVFTDPEVLGVDRARSVELRHVSRFLTSWPICHRYPRFDRSVHRIASFFAYSHSYPRMPVHMFPCSSHRYPCLGRFVPVRCLSMTWPFGRPFSDDSPFFAVLTNVFPQLGLPTKVFPRFGYVLYLLPLRQL